MINKLIEAACNADWRFGTKFHPEEQRLIMVAIIEAMRNPDPKVIARAADKLGIAPSDVTRLVGTWQILIDEALA